ncbi:MAG: PKD domain-containing protein [Bacteroidetes bacterium]|nr:MAG: PKD domain-containing protein [Bacteroidota bacterium]
MAAFMLPFVVLHAQPTICTPNAGPDQTICAPNCATLTATFCPTNATTAYTVAAIPYAPDPFNAGTAVPLTDDSWSQIINLPFPFCFYGTVYNQCIIGSNGAVAFSWGGVQVPGGYFTWPIPNTPVPTLAAGTPYNCIMGPWHDMNPSVGGTIRYATYGTAPCRRFVVSWNAVPMYSCGTPSTQQITLYEKTNIIDNYLQNKPLCAGWNGGKAIQAVQNAAGNTATVVPGRNTPTQWNANNDARRYTPSGAPTYTINWLNMSTMASAGNTASISVCPTATTTYQFEVTYTNCNNTTVTQSDQVVVTASQLIVNMNPTNVSICQGGNTQLNGTTPGAVTYSWSPAAGLSATNIPNPVASPTVTTTYTVTATDASGCQGTATVLVTVNPMMSANAGPDDTTCAGTPIQLNATGGTSYQWSPDPSLSATNISNPNATPNATTTYTVQVTDANGCVGTDQVTINVAPTPLALNSTGLPATCFGTCDGQGIVIPNGGYQPYTFAWSSGGAGPSEPNLCAGTYTITVTDVAGCSQQQTVTVTEPTAIALQTSSTTANCGQSDGSATVTPNGGTSPYIIAWSSGGNQTTESNLAAGTYTVTVTDANNCTSQTTVVVPNTPGVTAQVTTFTNVICNGACDGTADGSGINGTAPYNYSWSSGPATQNVTNLCPGTYTVTVTDANGCSGTETVTITEPPLVTLTPPASTTICIGQSAALQATGAGGVGPYVYDWQPGALTGNPVNVNPVVTTTYTMTATDANGCVSAPSQVTVTVNPPLTVTPSAAVTICPGGSTPLSAVGGGGNGTYTYTWQPGNLNGSPVNVSPNATTTYTVTVSDGCGTPVATGTVTVTVQGVQAVVFAASTPTSGCGPLCVNFVNTTPNTASVLWDFGDNTTSSAASPTHCFTTGSYSIELTVTDVNGCTGTTTMPNYVTVYPNPVADFTASPMVTTALSPNINFFDQSLGSTSWTWSFGDVLGSSSSLQNPSFNYPDTGTFMVMLTVTNSFGCIDSIEYPILIKEDYALYVPNTFTPNGDGINDFFFPLGIGIDPDRFEMLIFDRWGNLIYKTIDMTKGWDGKVQGHPDLAQIDTYVWKIITFDPDGSRRRYIGHVNLIK